MTPFAIRSNAYLRRNVPAFYHTAYVGWKKAGNPDYLNDLKNTFNNFSMGKLTRAAQELLVALDSDLPTLLRHTGLGTMTVCVVPRAKAEDTYHPNQLLFRSTTQEAIAGVNGLEDGTDHIRRHTNTKTTHLRAPIQNYDNDGPAPFPGITAQTCHISTKIKGKHILLVDDIYTPGVNIDEDAIQAFLDAGAHGVTFYAVGKTQPRG